MGAGLGLVSLCGVSVSFTMPDEMSHGVLHRLTICAGLAYSPPLFLSSGHGMVSWVYQHGA